MAEHRLRVTRPSIKENAMTDIRLSFKGSALISLGEYLGAPSNSVAIRELSEALDGLTGPVRFDSDEQGLIVPMDLVTEDLVIQVMRKVEQVLDDEAILGMLQWERVETPDPSCQYLALIIEEDGPETGCEVFGPFSTRDQAKAFADHAAQRVFDAYEENRILMGPFSSHVARFGVGPNPTIGMTPEKQLEEVIARIEERHTFLYGE